MRNLQLVPFWNKFKKKATGQSNGQWNFTISMRLSPSVKKALKEYDVFRIIQDREYISEFDRQTKELEKKQSEIN